MFVPIIAITIGITLLVYSLRSATIRKLKNSRIQALKAVQNFNMHEAFVSSDGNSAIAIDKSTKKICYINSLNQVSIYPHTALLESEILQDSKSVAKMSATRTIGGFMLGGFVAGGAGAIVGSLSGRSTTNAEVKQIILKMKINNLQSPSLTVAFMSELSYVKTNGWQGNLYRKAFQQASHWHDLITVLIKSADKEAQEKLAAGQENVAQAIMNNGQNKLPQGGGMLADELEKLHALKEKGILTEGEFQIQKNKLLN